MGSLTIFIILVIVIGIIVFGFYPEIFDEITMRSSTDLSNCELKIAGENNIGGEVLTYQCPNQMVVEITTNNEGDIIKRTELTCEELTLDTSFGFFQSQGICT